MFLCGMCSIDDLIMWIILINNSVYRLKGYFVK